MLSWWKTMARLRGRPALGLILSAAIVLALTGCATPVARSQEDLSRRPIRAVTTIGMISDIVRNVGGQRVQVIGLMGPGVDPHLYKATEGDVIRLLEADVVFYNGLHLEAKMGDVLERMRSRTRTVAVTDCIDRSLLLAPPQFEGAYDPHVWFDVTLWVNYPIAKARGLHLARLRGPAR